MARANLTDGELFERGQDVPADGGAIGPRLGPGDFSPNLPRSPSVDLSPFMQVAKRARNRRPFGEAWVVPVVVGSEP